MTVHIDAAWHDHPTRQIIHSNCRVRFGRFRNQASLPNPEVFLQTVNAVDWIVDRPAS